jgi:hypothetical protein
MEAFHWMLRAALKLGTNQQAENPAIGGRRKFLPGSFWQPCLHPISSERWVPESL